MPDQFLQRTAYRLTPLSPIHLGTGEVINWLQAFVSPSERTLTCFDPARLTLSETAARDIEELGEEALKVGVGSDPVGFIRKAQQKLKVHNRELLTGRTSVSAVMPRLAQRLDELTGSNKTGNSAGREAANNLAILDISKNPREASPIVPGSALKGALRTAWLDHLRSAAPKPADLRILAYQEALLQGKFDSDPFSGILVEDFFGASIPVGILQATNRPRKPRAGQERSQLPLRVAAILPAIALNGALRWKDRKGSKAQTPNLGSLLQACSVFHLDHWQSQSALLQDHVPDWWLKAMTALVTEVKKRADSTLVRLGKFATAESKTTRDREIAIMVGRGQPSEKRSNGTTFWLAGDEGDLKGIPFGWAILEPADQESLATPMLEAFAKKEPWSALISVQDLQPEVSFASPIDETTAEWLVQTVEAEVRSGGNLRAAKVLELFIKARKLDKIEKDRFVVWIKNNIKSFMPDAGERKKVYDELNRLT